MDAEYRITIEGPGVRSGCKITLRDVSEGFSPRDYPAWPRIVRTLTDAIVSHEQEKMYQIVREQDPELFNKAVLMPFMDCIIHESKEE